MYSLYAILGLSENASEEAVEAAYHRYHARLTADQFEPATEAASQCNKCLSAIEDAYGTLSDQDRRSRYQKQWQAERRFESGSESSPKLGQLCVASGMISLKELEDALQGQEALNLPLGEVLQDKKLITQAELDGLLLGQKLIQLPPDSPHCIGQRLIALGLVDEDMIRIVLIEQRTFEKRLGELLVAHGWIDQRLLEILLEPLQKASPETGRQAH